VESVSFAKVHFIKNRHKGPAGGQFAGAALRVMKHKTAKVNPNYSGSKGVKKGERIIAVGWGLG